MRKSELWMRHKLFIGVNTRLLASDNVVDNVLHKCTLGTAEGDGATVPCCMSPGYRLGQWQAVFWHKGARLSLARSTHADRERTAGKSHRICELRPAQQRGGGCRGGCGGGGGRRFHNSLTDTADSCLSWRRADAEKPGLHKLACI